MAVYAEVSTKPNKYRSNNQSASFTEMQEEDHQCPSSDR